MLDGSLIKVDVQYKYKTWVKGAGGLNLRESAVTSKNLRKG